MVLGIQAENQSRKNPPNLRKSEASWVQGWILIFKSLQITK